MMLSGWGRYPKIACRQDRLHDPAEASGFLSPHRSLIARGNGRAYGDAALNPALTLSALGAGRFVDFDPTTGELTCEAGALLSDILSVFVPHGWFPPVMPGTKFVTVGGMIASDVHGKNHHRDGSFGDHLTGLDVMLADGRVVRCSSDRNTELFEATIGGMGLTGVILRASFRMMAVTSAYLEAETVPADDLDAAMSALWEAEAWPYTVAWIDCLAPGARRGRSLISRARHLDRAALPWHLRDAPCAGQDSRGLRVPTDLPAFVLNGASVRAFNAAYYLRGRMRSARRGVVHYDRFFFPLDGLLDWNRIYGRRGFVQYQCVLPPETSARGLDALLRAVATARQGSFLAVLKRLGPGGGYLSFPMAGYTLALDLPIRGDTFALLDRLDDIVAREGGRVYLAKDARTSPEQFAAGYPDLAHFQELRRRAGAVGRFESVLSRRLEI